MCSAASGGTGAVCVPVCVHAFVSSVGLEGGGQGLRLRVPSVRLDVSNADADAVHLLLKKNLVPLSPPRWNKKNEKEHT